MSTTNPYEAALNTACGLAEKIHGKPVDRVGLSPRRFLLIERRDLLIDGGTFAATTHDTFGCLRDERAVAPEDYALVLAVDLQSGQTFTDDDLLADKRFEVTVRYTIDAPSESAARQAFIDGDLDGDAELIRVEAV